MTSFVLDVNVVVAAYRADHPQHDLVRPWLRSTLAVHHSIAVPSTVWASFVRIVTSRRIFPVTTAVVDAIGFGRALRAQPGHVPAEPGPRHLDLLERVCGEAGATGDLVPDAVLAAIALEHACTVASLDRDFARFTSLPWVRPGADR